MILHYLKVAWRVLVRRKFFTFVSVFGIALTLLVLVIVASLLDHVFGPRYPETRPDRTATVYEIKVQGEQSSRTGHAGYPLLDRTLRDLPGIERVSLHTLPQSTPAFPGGRRTDAFLKRTDAAFWRVFDFRFLEGAPYDAADEAAARPVVVINRTTRGRFFGDGPALGRQLELGGQRFRVVGVVEDVPILRLTTFSDVWAPLTTAKSDAWRNGVTGDFFGTLLAESPASLARAQAELGRRFSVYPLPDPQFKRLTGGADTAFQAVSRQFGGGDLEQRRPALLAAVLAVLALLFMVLPAVNLVNLNLSRILERESEIGVRRAFGGSSSDLVGQFLTENLVLTLLGGTVGLVLGAAVLAAVNASGVIPYAHLGIDLRVFLWGLLLSVVFAVVSGVYPAWRMSRLHPVEALRGRAS